MSGSRPLSCFLLSVMALTAALPASAGAGPIELLSWADPSLSLTSRTVGGYTERGSVSADGRYVVFTSSAANLVGAQFDLNGGNDVFVFDRTAGTTALVSHRSDSAVTTANGVSGGGWISADGRYILFASQGTDLVSGQDDSNGGYDFFLFDRLLGTNVLVTHAAGSASRTADHPIDSNPTLSADGSRVAFVSTAADLIDGFESGASYNVFLYDRASGTNTLVSHKAGSAVAAGGSNSFTPVLSGDGRYVAFRSFANDLVAGQVDASSYDVFLYDQTTGTSLLVSRANGSPVTAGNGASAMLDISRDGRYILFYSHASNLTTGPQDTNGYEDLFLFDRVAGSSILVSRAAGSLTTGGNGRSYQGVLSGDGRYVAFTSQAVNLVPGTYASAENLFLFGREAGTTVLVSHSAVSPTTSGNGLSSLLPTISFDGAYVAFASDASDLVAGDTNGKLDGFLYERATAQVQRVGPVEPYQAPEVTNDGGSVVLTSPAADLVPGDLNGDEDVFLWQRATGTFTAVSAYGPSMTPATPSGDSGPQGISADGRYVAFISYAPNILLPAPQVDANSVQLDVFLRDRVAGTTVLVSHVPGNAATTADGWSGSPSLSADGKIIAFLSSARNLVAGPVQTTFFNDIFVYDRTTGEVSLVSHAAGSPTQPAAGDSWNAVVSRDGRFVLFTSFATDLVAGQSDNADSLDVFLHDRVTGETVLVSHASDSALTAAGGSNPVLDAQGHYVAFVSVGSGLVAGQRDANGVSDVFLYDRVTGTSRLVSHIPSSTATTGASFSWSPSISADGGLVAFTSSSPELVDGVTDTNGVTDVFLYDVATGTVALVSRASDSIARTANERSMNPVLSGDGRWTAFTSRATDLVPGMIANGQYSLLRFDRVSGTLDLVSQHASAYAAVIADDGGTLAYYGDLESPGDGGLILDDRLRGEKVVVSPWPYAQIQQVPAEVVRPPLDADGSVLAFASLAPNLVPDDRNGRWDAFALDRSGGLSGGQSFFTLPPCRVLDSRQPQAGSAFASESPRIVSLIGLCGIPASARAISVNVTVTQATGAGHLTIGSSDRPLPATSTINFGAGQTRANNAILSLPLNGLGALRVSATVAGGGTVQVLIDVNGYFE